jgi:hypothetical protein
MIDALGKGGTGYHENDLSAKSQAEKKGTRRSTKRGVYVECIAIGFIP